VNERSKGHDRVNRVSNHHKITVLRW